MISSDKVIQSVLCIYAVCDATGKKMVVKYANDYYNEAGENHHSASALTELKSVANKPCLLWYIVRHCYEHRAVRVGWQEQAWVGGRTGNVSNTSNMIVHSVR